MFGSLLLDAAYIKGLNRVGRGIQSVQAVILTQTVSRLGMRIEDIVLRSIR